MAKNETKNLHLVLPDEDDAYNINEFNDDFQRIDNAFDDVGDLKQLKTNDRTSLVNAINEVFSLGSSDDWKKPIIQAITAADSSIRLNEKSTIDDICKGIQKIADNWVTKDKKTRQGVCATINRCQGSNYHSLAELVADWANVRTFISNYMIIKQ